MKSEREKKQAIFDALLKLSPEKRSAYLDTAAGDATLRARIESLLVSFEAGR